MIDKKNYDNLDPNNQNDGVNFSYDLDLDKDIDMADNLSLPADDMIMSDELAFGLDPNAPITSADTNRTVAGGAKNTNIVDFLKSYGIVILIGGVFIYFGLKYSVGTMLSSGQPASEQTTATLSNEPGPLGLSPGPTDASGAPITTDTPGPAGEQSNLIPDNAATQPPAVAVDGSMPAATPDLFGAPPATSAPVEIASPQSAPPPPPQEIVGTPPADTVMNQSMPMAAAEPSQLTLEMNQKLSNLITTVEGLNQKVNAAPAIDTGAVTEIQQQMKTVNTQMEQLVTYVQGVSKAMGMLSEQVRKQQAALATFVNSSVGLPASKKKGEVGLTIDAIISGRAWLRTVQGDQLTVAKGDKIPGYGKVIEINSRSGTVTTDVGTVLTQ